MADFLEAYKPVKDWEGGWCHVAGDAGGETYAGIARNFHNTWSGWVLIDQAKSDPSYKQGARAFSNYLDKIPGLRDSVTAWYKKEWWDRMGLQDLPQAIANELFEQAINLGRGGAGRYLQRLCNALNWTPGEGTLFKELEEDGVVGKLTLGALQIIMQKRKEFGEAGLLKALNSLQGAHYIGLAAKNKAHRKFLTGWMTRA